MKIRLLFAMIATSLLLLSTQSIASCYFYGVDNMYATKTFTIPISLTLSVPAGIQNGQTIYKQKNKPAGPQGIIY